MSESDWQRLDETFNTSMADFGPVLRSEAVTVLPQDLVLALVRLEAGGRTLEIITSNAQLAYQDVLPAYHERRVPLPDADASRVRRLRAVMQEMAAAEQSFSPLVGEIVAALDRWR